MSVAATDIVRAAIDAAAEELQKHGMTAELKRLPRLFIEALEGMGGVMPVTIITPTGNAGTLRESIVSAIERKTGKKVSIEEKADPGMIGGVILQFGDERIDYSVRGALEGLEEEMRSVAHS